MSPSTNPLFLALWKRPAQHRLANHYPSHSCLVSGVTIVPAHGRARDTQGKSLRRETVRERERDRDTHTRLHTRTHTDGAQPARLTAPSHLPFSLLGTWADLAYLSTTPDIGPHPYSAGRSCRRESLQRGDLYSRKDHCSAIQAHTDRVSTHIRVVNPLPPLTIATAFGQGRVCENTYGPPSTSL